MTYYPKAYSLAELILPFAMAAGLIYWAGQDGAVLGTFFWVMTFAAWFLACYSVIRLADIPTRDATIKRVISIAIPVMFGAWILILWELFTTGLNVPSVLLPPPSAIGVRFMASVPILWADFRQTFLKAVLIGFFLGCASGFIVAILADRFGFLRRGLLPLGNLVAALPIIGVAPIMVMWFGFDWPSKAAVVVIMTFFPMLINTVAGLT